MDAPDILRMEIMDSRRLALLAFDAGIEYMIPFESILENNTENIDKSIYIDLFSPVNLILCGI